MKNLIRILLPVFFCWSPFFTHAQMGSLPPVEYNMEGSINLAENQLLIIDSLSSDTSLFKVDLVDGELILSFNIDPLSKKTYRVAKTPPTYNVAYDIQLDSNSIFPFEENLKGNFRKNKKGGKKEIIWTNLVETYQQLEGRLTVKVTTTIKTDIGFNCKPEYRPEFSQKEKIKHYVLAGVGVGLIGYGLVVEDRAQRIYNEEYLTATDFGTAEPIYKRANDLHQESLILTFAGIAIIAVDAGWYFFKNQSVKREIEIFEQFCPGITLQVQPSFELDLHGSGNSYAGMQMTFTF